MPLKIAYISPLNPLQSGISDYSEALLPALSEFVQIELYSDCGVPSNPQIAERFRIYPVLDLIRNHFRYDLRLYQLGNSPHHRNAFSLIRVLPGIVVLHEPFLHHGFYHSSSTDYRRELLYELGSKYWSNFQRVEQALREDNRHQLLETPLIQRIVDVSLGILVHSNTARRIVERCLDRTGSFRGGFPKLGVISQPMEVSGSYELSGCRAMFGLPQDGVIFGMAGFIHPVKEPALVLQAFAKFQTDFPNSMLLLAGDVLQETGDLVAMAGEMGIAEKVLVLGRVEPLERFHQALAACDVILNLRRATIGETSAVALRAMALGKPVIVRNIGWFSELPDDVCVKIEPEDGVEKLAAVMRTLASSPEMRHRIGQKARDYVRHTCDPLQVARQYAEFLQDVYLSIVNS